MRRRVVLAVAEGAVGRGRGRGRSDTVVGGVWCGGRRGGGGDGVLQVRQESVWKKYQTRSH